MPISNIVQQCSVRQLSSDTWDRRFAAGTSYCRFQNPILSIFRGTAMQMRVTFAEGVRNARARNILQAMRTGQSAFLYQSACKTPGVVGIVKIVKEAYPDDTQFDPKSKYYDAKSTKERPKWFMVDIQLVRTFKSINEHEQLDILYAVATMGCSRDYSKV